MTDPRDRFAPSSLTTAGMARLWLIAVAAGLAAAGCGGAPPPAETPTGETGIAVRSAALSTSCTGAAANPKSCFDAQHEETQPPPPPTKPCTIQVMMEQVDVVKGQGLSEGKLEVSVTAEAGDGPVTWPDSGTMKMKEGYPKVTDVLVAEHPLSPNQVRTINVCATFNEDDSGLNGADDVGSDCEPVVIRCSMSPLTKTVSADLCRGGDCTHLHGAMSAQFRISVSDEDQDGIANDDDFTPKPADEACRGQLGEGIVVYVEQGGSNLTNLVQMIETSLDDLATGYDFIAIAASPEVYDGYNNTAWSLRRGTIGRADMVVPATFKGLMSAYRAATSRGYAITHFVIGDGGTNGGVAYFTSADPSGTISASTLATALTPASIGTCAVPFAMVYSVASYMSRANDMWINAGAKAAAAPTFIHAYPQFVVGIGAAWNAGQTLANSIGAGFDANIQSSNNDAIEQVGTSAGCDPTLGASVLGTNLCSNEFFTGQQPHPELDFNADGRTDFVPTLSGEQNLAAGALNITAGDDAVTRSSALTW